MTDTISSTRTRDKSRDGKFALIARGCLKELREIVLPDRGWKTLPQGRRGQRILAWAACMAWEAYPARPEAGVRRVCEIFAPYLEEQDWADLIAATAEANRHFTPDQSAAVTGVGVRDHLRLRLRFIGCDDDACYEVRAEQKQIRDAERKRRKRAELSTGRKPGRPRLELSAAEREERRKQQGAERAARYRAKKAAADASGASRKTPSSIKYIDCPRTQFSVTEAEGAERQKRDGAMPDIVVDDGDFVPLYPTFDGAWPVMAAALSARRSSELEVRHVPA